MKLKPITHSAFFYLRALLAFALCIAGGLLALCAVGAIPAPFAEARGGSQTRSAAVKSASDSRNSLVTSLKKMVTARGGAARTVSGGGRRAPANASPSTPQDNTVRKQRNYLGQTVYSISPSHFDISPPLTELAQISLPQQAEEQLPELPLPPWRILRSNRPDPVTQVAPAGRDFAKLAAPMVPATGFNFEAIPGIPLDGFPPDTNGSVGNDQYVETVNTRYQVWSLNRATNTATSILGPVNINTLWAGFGGACQSQNSGDPVVLYDKVANRWLISQFTASISGGNYYQCVAISTTANAAGTYARYSFVVPDNDFGDYPKYGVWTDAYYVMAHHFTFSPNDGTPSFVGGAFGAMNRAKMLMGDPTATWQVIIDPLEGGHMPADLDGFAPPPGGAPGIFVSAHGDGMYLYRMKVDFITPANTARTLQAIIPIAPASAACGGGNCIPQPQSAFTIDSLADRLMFRLAYRNFIDHESLVISHSVDPGVTGVVSGVRWYDFRISGQPDAVCSSYPCTRQQGTVADVANGRSRWMPSISMDGAENILVGYSATGTVNGIDNHSIRYTGRAKGDPLGTMTVPETIIFTGTMNIVNDPAGFEPGRWGDYTSMSIDPADDCTFWYANEYYPAGGTTNADWHTRIASSSFPAGTDLGQCQPTTCTARPTSAPTIGTASVPGNNQIQVTWTGITPTPGSYAIERAVGAVGNEGLYQPLAFVPGTSTSFTDTTVQGGVTYTYRVIAATDAAGKCQALVRSGGASATATGSCNLEPTFAGVTSATSLDGPACGITLNWSPGHAGCPFRQLKYNIYRGTVPDFVPSASNRIANCVTGPNSYVDADNLTSGNTYYYVVRAEDNGTGGGGACGGNEESNNVHIAGTAYGAGTQSTTGTWMDGGGDGTAFLRLNTTGTGNSDDPAWRFVRTADDPGANHTPGGAYAYRNAGPGPNAIYSANVCAVAETPVLTVGSTTLNLTYWERHQMEKGWDGVAIEYSRNGSPWTDVPAPSSATADGCMISDITTDYAALDCTGDPPINACGYPASKAVITGPATLPVGDCTTWMTGDLTAYGRRCHLLTGLTPGDTIQFRWRFTSDPGAQFKGFYLDDIAVTNIRLRNSCTATPATRSIGGTVSYCASSPTPRPVQYVTLNLTGDMTASATTDGSGFYELSAIVAGGNYTVTPTPLRDLQPVIDPNPNVGDALTVQQHFNSGGTLLTGCQELAAHTTGTPMVDIGDALAIQQFFNNSPRPPTNVTGQWRFVPASRSYPSLMSNQTAQNYDTYILGDVTGSAVFPTPTPPIEPLSSSGGGANSRAKAAVASSRAVPPQGSRLQPIMVVSLPKETISGSGEFVLGVTISRIDPAIHGQLQAFQGDLSFDSSVVSFDSPAVQRAGLTNEGNWALAANVLGTGRMKTLRVSCFAVDGQTMLSGSGTLFELRMRRVGSIQRGGSTALVWAGAPSNFVLFDANLQREAPASAPPGYIRLGQPAPASVYSR